MQLVSPRAGALLPSSKRYFPSRFPEVLQVKVVDINMKSWTVDVVSSLTGRYWADVQVGALYLHQYAGEGMYCLPDVGAVCQLCLPTDTSGPFIMAYVSPGQTTRSGQQVDAQQDADQPANQPVDYSYSSNRPNASPGDIVMRGRDGNFVLLHRGGVLQIGSSELAQRIYVPLSNMITDISEHYEHQNVAGTIKWGMQPFNYQKRETYWRQCFRVFADEKYCDVRLTVGNVVDPAALPDGDEDLNDVSTANPLVYELVLIPADDNNGFQGVDGTVVPGSQNQMKMLFKFDRNGNCYTRFEGNAMLAVKKDLFVKVKGAFKLQAKSIEMTTTGDATLGADGTTNVKGKLVKLAGGGVGVARLMDMVMIPGPQLVMALGQLGVTMMNPGAAASPTCVIQGAITTSSQKTETS
jgi:hypothetical protein